MTCCNQNCQQGRTCPNRSDISQLLIDMATVAMSVFLIAVVISVAI